MEASRRTDFALLDRLACELLAAGVTRPDGPMRARMEDELAPYLENLVRDRAARAGLDLRPEQAAELVTTGQRCIDGALRSLQSREVNGRLPPRSERPGFGSYASWWARQAIGKALRSDPPLGRSARSPRSGRT